MRKTIAFIGVGNMASAIINGVTSGSCGAVTMSNMVLYDKYSEKTLQYKAMGATVVSSEREAVEQADCIFLCAKPQNFPEILPCFSDIPNVCNKLFVTIAAGIKMQSISDAAGGAPVIRVLPNTPIFIGKGVSAICKTQNVCDEDFKFVCNIFSSSSSILPIDEDQMNRIIGVTSSSPAYVFKFIKAMYEGAVAQGLPDDNLVSTVCDMIIGSAELIKSGFGTPEKMVNAVASKGGTTERALAVLDENNFEQTIIDAMKACTARADELGKIK